MGYRLPPALGARRIYRGAFAVRRFLSNVPGPDSALWLLGGPGDRMRLGVDMQVVPHKDKWEWRVSLTFNDHPSLMGYVLGGSWRHPAPHEVRGRCRNQGDAWMRAREVADLVRARHAEVQNAQMRRHGEAIVL